MLYSDASVILTVSFMAAQPQIMVAIHVLPKVPRNWTRPSSLWKPDLVDEVKYDRITVSHHPGNVVAVVDLATTKAVRICLVYVDP